MQIKFNLISTILLLGAVQGFFLALMLFQKRGNHKANQILAALVLFYSVFIADAALDGMNFYYVYPQFWGLFRGLPYLFGVFHFLYAKKLISPEEQLSRYHLLHFGLFVIYRIYSFSFDFESAQFKLAFLQGPPPSEIDLFHFLSSYVIFAQGLIYMVWTIFMLQGYSQKIKELFSAVDKINLNWLRNITFLGLIAWIVATLERIFPETMSDLFFGEEFPVAFVLTVLVYSMGYLGQRQPQIFAQVGLSSQQEFSASPDKREDASNEEESALTSSKYGKSGLSQEKATLYLEELLKLMEKEKPFLNSTITLSELSEKLSLSSHNLSEIINTQLKQSFFDFINKYRIEEVKKALDDPEKSHYTLLSIAFDSGFNSKTSFNTVFKKHTNLTPSQYKKVLSVAT